MAFGKFNQSKRKAALQDIARELDMAFTEKDEYKVISYLKDFKLFRKGHSRRLKNLMRSDNGKGDQKVIADYRYVVQAGNTPVTIRQTVYFRYNKAFKLPNFLMIPERWYHQVGQWFGMQDVDFMLYPKFSKEYLLQGADPEFLQKAFDDKLLEFFSNNHNWSVEGEGYFMIFYQDRKIKDHTEIKQFIKTGDTVSRLLLDVSNNL